MDSAGWCAESRRPRMTTSARNCRRSCVARMELRNRLEREDCEDEVAINIQALHWHWGWKREKTLSQGAWQQEAQLPKVDVGGCAVVERSGGTCWPRHCLCRTAARRCGQVLCGVVLGRLGRRQILYVNIWRVGAALPANQGADTGNSHIS